MVEFFRQRGVSLALIVLVMLLDTLVQFSISYTLAFGELRGPLGLNTSTLANAAYLVQIGLLALMAALWLLG